MRIFSSPHFWMSLGQATLAALLVLLPLVFATNTLEMFEYPKTTVLQLGALLLTAVLVSHTLANSSTRLLPRDPLTIGVLCFAVSVVLSTLLSSAMRLSLRGGEDSFAGLNTVAAYIIVYFAARRFLANRRAVECILPTLVAAGGAAAVYALLQLAHLDPLPWAGASVVGIFTRPAGPLGHPNHLAEFLALACPPTLYFAARAFRQRVWLAFGLLAVLQTASGVAIVASLSRAGWLGLACALAVLLAGGWRLVTRPTRMVVGGLLAIGVVAGLALTAAGAWPAVLQQRLAGLTAVDSRALLWQAALDIVCRHPVCGSGLETFQIAFCEVRTPAYWQVEWPVLPNHAHNQFLHILATQGIVGALATLAMLAGLVVAGVRAWRRAPTSDKGLVLVLLAMAAAILATSLFSFTVAAVGVTFAVTAGMLAGWNTFAASKCTGPRWGLVVAAVLAVAALAWNIQHAGTSAGIYVLLGVGAALALAAWACWRCLPPEQPTAHIPAAAVSGYVGVAHGVTWAGVAVAAVLLVIVPHRANVLCKSGEDRFTTDPDLGIRMLQNAVSLDAGRDVCWTRLGGALHAAALRTTDADERCRRFQEARRALERARQLQPLNGYHHDNLARLLGALASQGGANPDEAFTAFDAALARDPCNVLFCLDAAQVALALHDTARCRQYAGRARRLDPQFAPPLAQLGYASLLDRRLEEACALLESARGLAWREQSDEELTAGANLVMAQFYVGNLPRVCQLAPALLARAPQLHEVRRALEESQRRRRRGSAPTGLPAR
jgi:O-antigen ligase/tetratricopeptide (TPR) repeat protein